MTTAVPAGSLLEQLATLGIVSLAELVSNVVEFEEVSMSHAAYRLSVDGSMRAFVKRSDPVRSQGRDLGCEATLYRLAAYEPSLAQIIPRCQAVSPDGTLVVLDVVPTPPDGAHWMLSGPVLEGVAGHPMLRAYGQAVATIHAVRPAPFGTAPWLLDGVESGSFEDPRLPSCVRSLYRRIAATPHFRRAFADASRSWQDSALIHGDLRWTNVLPVADPSRKVVLVDWELCCRGDPAWDVGAVLADIVASTAVATRVEVGRHHLVSTASPFLSAYQTTAEHTKEDWRALITRATLYGGLRLIQTVAEYGHVDPLEMNAIEPLLLAWSAELVQPAGPLAVELIEAAASR